jgi:hypothetical protein
VEPSRQLGVQFWARAVVGIATHPSLWLTAVVQLLRCSPQGWWRRPPFLPRPDGAYTEFRLTTQYGAATDPDPADLLTYLSWCRDESRGRRRTAGDPGSGRGRVRHRL